MIVFRWSKQVNSGTDTIRSTSSSQHQRERQTNTIKPPQKNRWQAELVNPFPKRWQLCYPKLTEYIFNIHSCYITKTCLYNFDPRKPHFYIIKLGFTGVYIMFLVSAKNIDCGYSLEPPRRGGSNEYPQPMFWAEIWKISEFLAENFQFLVVIFSIHLNRRVFVMKRKKKHL